MVGRPAAARRAGRLALAAGPLLLALAAAPSRAVGEADTTALAVDTTPFVVHRVANPRYHAPLVTATPVAPGATGRLRALDRMTAQFYGHDTPGPGAATQWQIGAVEQWRNEDALEVFAAGATRPGSSALEAVRLAARRGGFVGALGDQEPLGFGRFATITRLRGAMLRQGGPESGWVFAGGVPTAAPWQPKSRVAVAVASLDGFRFDEAFLSLTGIAFTRRHDPLLAPADGRAGRGGVGSFGWRAPIGASWLTQRLGSQLHGLDGSRRLAIQHELQWNLVTPRFAATVASERNTRDARTLASDQLLAAPRAEDRWSLQGRSASGRAEALTTGVLRRGGDAALETRTVGLGASGSFGRSGWYGGADATWDTRLGRMERRIGTQVGHSPAAGALVLARLEYGERQGERGSVAALGEASWTLRQGARLELEPRLGWSQGLLQHGQLATRLGWALGTSGVRLTGTLAVGAEREQRFRGGVREVAVAFSCVPRLRDRADLEARRLDENGRAVMEYSARYDATIQRYEGPSQWIAARDTGRVTVIVGRSGNGSGVPDVLVSLDGQALRFTDADGVARFDRVPPGVHTVAIEERSLPENVAVTGPSRVFVTVERARAPEPVRFTIGRLERKTRFEPDQKE